MDYCSLDQVKSRLPDMGDTENQILDELVSAASEVVDSFTRRPYGFGQTVAVRLFDGNDTRKLFTGDLISVSQLRVKSNTSAAFVVVPTADYRLRPVREQGEPARWIEIVDIITGTVSRFYEGFDTVEVTGSWGWPTIPSAVETATIELVISMYRSRGSGTSDPVGVGELQQPVIPRTLPALSYRLLQPYIKTVWA